MRMTLSNSINIRARAIGSEIFERASAAEPRVWQKAWWLERLTRVLDEQPDLKVRAFTFVDCLPALTSPAQITRHLAEYLDPKSTGLPPSVTAVLEPGPLQRLREDCIGAATLAGANKMAGRFITGHDIASVMDTLVRLRGERMGFTLDVLGEFTTSDRAAARYASVYANLIDQLAPIARGWPGVPLIDQDEYGEMPRVNLSIKLTGLYAYFDAIDPAGAIRGVMERLRPLLTQARQAGAFVNIDMEAVKHRNLTLELFKTIAMDDEFRDWPHLGIVVQAYLVDGEKDLQELIDLAQKRGRRFSIRLVKGAYWDAETAAAVRSYSVPPVWTKKWESDACYERMSRVMLENVHLIKPAFASHNVRSLAAMLAMAESLGVAANQYEVQMLYGMGDPLKTALVQMGRTVRVYCPFGDLMPGMGYLIRRLLENTSNDSFLKQSFSNRAGYDQLLADPDQARPSCQPLPTRNYQDTDQQSAMNSIKNAVFKNAVNTSFSSQKNRQRMQGAIQFARGELGRDHPMLIDGESVTTGEWFTSVNPSKRSEVVGRIAVASTGDVDRAVAAARRAFDGWRKTPAVQRADLLRKAADRLAMRRFELAAMMTLEVGKPWREADADVSEAIDHARFYADQIVRLDSRPRLRNMPGEDNRLIYTPKGVCAILSPWPFPLAILSGMATAALAAGNTVVIKPARKASIVGGKLVEIFRDIGFPAGVINLITGYGETIGQHLVAHSDVHVVAFTGTERVGREVLHAGSGLGPSQALIKKMIVEMGGKNAIIVDDDADLDSAVQATIESSFAFAGQKCSSCSRLIVLDGVYDAMLQKLRDATESLPIGGAEEPGTMVGPLVDEEAVLRTQEYIELGKKEGRLLVQAALPPSCADGFFVPPTVFADVPAAARIAQEEILGPVLSVIRAADFEQAIEIANQTRYALTGGVFSRSPVHIELACRDFAAGNLYINRRITGSQVDAQPFGGFKLSGTGVKAGSPDYILHFMDARCITENTLRSGLVPHEEASKIS